MFCFVLLVTKLADVLFNNVSITQFWRDFLFQKVFEFEENFDLCSEGYVSSAVIFFVLFNLHEVCTRDTCDRSSSTCEIA